MSNKSILTYMIEESQVVLGKIVHP